MELRKLRSGFIVMKPLNGAINVSPKFNATGMPLEQYISST
jgi:hypothetical protein